MGHPRTPSQVLSLKLISLRSDGQRRNALPPERCITRTELQSETDRNKHTIVVNRMLSEILGSGGFVATSDEALCSPRPSLIPEQDSRCRRLRFFPSFPPSARSCPPSAVHLDAPRAFRPSVLLSIHYFIFSVAYGSLHLDDPGFGRIRSRWPRRLKQDVQRQ